MGLAFEAVVSQRDECIDVCGLLAPVQPGELGHHLAFEFRIIAVERDFGEPLQGFLRLAFIFK